MTMKKRFLGLALAAMVAVPATTAYAASNVTVQGENTKTLSHTLTVSGSISNKQGSAPAGKLQVELPTAMAFTVDQESNFVGGTYNVVNRSAVPITLSVAEFRDANPTGGITLVEGSSFNPAEKDRSHVAISLDGNVDGTPTFVDLKSLDGINPEDVLSVNANDTGILELNGEAGTKTADDNGGNNVDAKGAKEDFTLLFKIKKK